MVTDAEFAVRLRGAVNAYLRALDAWEETYARFYRMPGPHGRISGDLEQVHAEYVGAFRELESLMARAQRLCMRHELRNPWPALVRSRPSVQAPQTLAASGVGRNERVAIGECLRQLELACDPAEGSRAAAPQVNATPPRGLLQRLRAYFL